MTTNSSSMVQQVVWPLITGSRSSGSHRPRRVQTPQAGIPGSVTQANVLRNIAPRLTARSDTFRIRGYGEVTDADGNIIAKATCEAVVQRLPEYVDPRPIPTNNEPWDEGCHRSIS